MGERELVSYDDSRPFPAKIHERCFHFLFSCFFGSAFPILIPPDQTPLPPYPPTYLTRNGGPSNRKRQRERERRRLVGKAICSTGSGSWGDPATVKGGEREAGSLGRRFVQLGRVRGGGRCSRNCFIGGSAAAAGEVNILLRPELSELQLMR